MDNLTKELILKILYENRKEIRNFGVKKLILFGSYARDEQKKDSDIDFLVEFEKGRGLYEDYSNLLNLLEKLFHRKIDLLKLHLIRDELKPYILGGIKYEARV